jgi:hypothetical protein
MPAKYFDPKTRAEFRTVKTDSVRVVERALRKNAPFDTGSRKARECSAYCSADNGVYLLLKSGKWTGFRNGQDVTRIDGAIGGWNTRALEAITPLVLLGLITRTQGDAFEDWFHEYDAKIRFESQFVTAKRVVEQYGYEVVERKP